VTRLHICALLCCSLLAARAQADEPAPIRRIAFIIGANDGGKERVHLRFAETDARAMASVLETLGGVSARDRFLLLNPTKAEVVGGVEHLREILSRRESGAKRTELFVYYSGHSDEEGLLLGEEKLGYGDLRHAIESLPADVRIVVLDSCASGAMTRQKGGVRRPPFLTDDSTKVQGHAIITSSAENESAQESDRIGGSFFTHYLVSGLRGAADASHDGRVTLNEAYQFAFDETLARTAQTQAGAQHPAYDIQLSGSGDLVMTDLRGSSAKLVLPAEMDGRVYVRDADGRLAAELRKVPGRAIELGLDPGTYSVTLATTGEMLGMQVTLSDGRRTQLAASEMKHQPKEWAVARGGKFVDPPLELQPTQDLTKPAEPEYTSVPIVVGVLPGIDNGMLTQGKVSAKAAFSLPFGRVDQVDGVQLGIISWVSDDLQGLDVNAGASFIGGNMRGVQAAGGFNFVRGSASGLQLASGFNVSGQSADSALLVQAAAGFNYARDFRGAQISLLNIGGDISGAQIGLINIAGKVKGTQIGLLNIADDVDGVPIGLLSYSRTGILNLELWTGSNALANASLKIGSKHFYTLLSAHYGTPLYMNCDCQQFAHPWASFGLGVHLPFWRLATDIDVSGGGGFDGDDNRGHRSTVFQARAGLHWQPFTHFGILGGFSANLAVTEQHSVALQDGHYSLKSPTVSSNALWPGFFAGLQF
jgi:hypothetical protein